MNETDNLSYNTRKTRARKVKLALQPFILTGCICRIVYGDWKTGTMYKHIPHLVGTILMGRRGAHPVYILRDESGEHHPINSDAVVKIKNETTKETVYRHPKLLFW